VKLSSYSLLIVLSFVAVSGTQAEVAQNNPDDVWWYKTPADKYWAGLPLSNGSLSAMVLGRVRDEVIPINETSLWSGSPYDPNNPEGPKILPQIRKLLLDGDLVQAQKLCEGLMSRPRSVQHYQPLGELRIRFNGPDRWDSYRRELDMDSAIARVTYRIGDVRFTREVFVSYPDQVMVVHLTADKPGQVSFSARLASIQPSGQSILVNHQLVMSGMAETVTRGASANPIIPSKMRWQARMKIVAEGGVSGACRMEEDEARTAACLEVEKADSATIIVAAATNFVRWNDLSGNAEARAIEQMKAADIPYASLRTRHLNDWRPKFLLCKLDLGGHAAGSEDTTARLEKLRKGGFDPLFEAQYFQYGRYLLLAVSRPRAFAFNNHNVWLDNMEGRWQGRWTLNINLQECYWPAENTNLAYTNEALLKFVEQLSEAGARTAKELYGVRGWVAHHGTDIWMNTAPTDFTGPGIWPTGGAWLLQNLWEHYAFEPDDAYLRRLYPLLKGSSEFFLDFLREEPVHHWLVTAPSVSPENSFFTVAHVKTQVGIGPTLDNQLLRDLFDHTVQAASTLGADTELQSRIRSARDRLSPTRVGKHGQIQEWLEDYEEPEVTHRHLSPLYAFYPSNQIKQSAAPELVNAVETTLDRRGEDNRGWSGGWKINLRARLGQGDRAESLLRRMLTDISIHPRAEDSNDVPSFEGNQGIQAVTAGIAEMLVQSHEDAIQLLPALPTAWASGSVSGLRARGGFTLDLCWKDGRLASVTIKSARGSLCRLAYKGKVVTIPMKAGAEYTRNGSLDELRPHD
jgi:alpha-L-fucosidase 2